MAEDNGNGRNGADVALKVAGQEINLKNVKSLNTLATVTTLMVAILIAYVVWEHKAEAAAQEVRREAAVTQRDALIAGAIREFTKSQDGQAKEQRISNCLMDKLLNSNPTQRGTGGSHLAECERIAR